jgi:hypothetical protein
MLRTCRTVLLIGIVHGLAIGMAGVALGSTAADSGPALESAEAEQHFAAGTERVRAGDFGAALEEFLAARDAGMPGPAVHYNIGVCAWETGDLSLAETAFRKAAQTPSMAPLAHYNLGLVALRRGDVQEAESWFRRAYDDSDDPRLAQLAVTQLERLGAAPPAVSPPRVVQAHRVFLAANAGYDDNIALVADGELLGVGDVGSTLAELQLAATGTLHEGLGYEAGLFALRYPDVDDFDQEGLQFNLFYRPGIGAWQGELGAGFGLNRLDGSAFENRRVLLLGASRPLAADWTLRLRHRYEDINGRSPYAGLSGTRHESAARLLRSSGIESLRLEYRLELNDRDSDALSPDRHRVNLEWSRRLGGERWLSLGADWRQSRFSLPDSRWTERRTTLSAGLTGPLPGRWEWTVQGDWTHNSASIAEFEYNRYRLTAGVQAIF